MGQQQKLADQAQLDFVDDKTAALLLNTPRSARIMLWMVVLFFICAIIWAAYAEIDKVTVGQGKVIPSSQLQIVQNLEGGIVKSVLIKEGDFVEKDQQLLLIDDTRFQSDFRERKQQLVSLQGDIIRLQAELNAVHIDQKKAKSNWRKTVLIKEIPLEFSAEFGEENSKQVRQQRAEYRDNMNNLRNQLSVLDQQIRQKEQELIEVKATLRNLKQSYHLAAQELKITRPLAEEGVVPRVELLKLQRQVNDTRRDMTATQLQIPQIESSLRETIFKRIEVALSFRADQQLALNEVEDELSAMSESQVGLEDKVQRTIVLSPVTGTIKKIHINTVGGVIQPGMDLVEIVPSEDNLLVEAKIAPKDIAFLRPGLTTIVKFTAYDFTVYGGLQGDLETISADTIKDEEGNEFYLIKVRTNQNFLGENGQKNPIIPGMTASVDIMTGKQSVLDYLLKPILRAKQNALRE
ncbi:Type I secretion system membrane fusion protein PrsE [Vibrio stylophorae]|uniref:Membrane fusion protein (MFP) family protein n=1 Tax=Vibrio stylophorae TaxID=659351 RepID=A0ABM8ZY73_9VIBR|nr:HlyD family type I secretion periplasmic adaptor subunit [Vibrio stylophorae]CAH0535807.1 Type I secretion system membrane fusion protein PrsE [Vibrio stylophorae]